MVDESWKGVSLKVGMQLVDEVWLFAGQWPDVSGNCSGGMQLCLDGFCWVFLWWVINLWLCLGRWSCNRGILMR